MHNRCQRSMALIWSVGQCVASARSSGLGVDRCAPIACLARCMSHLYITTYALHTVYIYTVVEQEIGRPRAIAHWTLVRSMVRSGGRWRVRRERGPTSGHMAAMPLALRPLCTEL